MIKFQNLLTILILAAGLIIAGLGINRILEAKACKNWKILKGRVLSSMVREDLDSKAKGQLDIFSPDITYEYRYEGKVYFNETIGYIPSKDPKIQASYYSGSEAETKNFIKKFPANSVIDVYVNSETPQESVLETDLKIPVFIPFFFGTMLIMLGLYLQFFGDKYINFNKEKTKEG